MRLEKIVELIRESRFSIHDLSRIQSNTSGELARLNMPFELGTTYGISIGNEGSTAAKRLLVIAKDRYGHQKALSDIAGWDIRAHGGDADEAIRQVRTWLRSHHVAKRSSSGIIGDYTGFQEWDYERLLADGWDARDIKERETGELLEAMKDWRDADRPVSFS